VVVLGPHAQFARAPTAVDEYLNVGALAGLRDAMGGHRASLAAVADGLPDDKRRDALMGKSPDAHRTARQPATGGLLISVMAWSLGIFGGNYNAVSRGDRLGPPHEATNGGGYSRFERRDQVRGVTPNRPR
jgi:hypothetical protein